MDHILHTSGSDHESPGLGKKRKVGASGRGVASLTPEQLAKKRANDREAQRAIRERTKATIDSLERRIQELTSQQPYQELQAVIRQKEAIQAENEEIRRRLTSIMSIIQPLVGAQGLTDLATAASHNVQLGFNSASSNVFHQDQYLNNGQPTRSYHSPNLSSDETSTFAQPFVTSDQDQSSDTRIWSSSRDALNQQRDNLQSGLQFNESGERLSFNFLLGGVNNQAPPQSKASQSSTIPHALETSSNQPVHTLLSKNCPPTCPLDGVLMNFLHERKHEASAANNIPPPAYPSVSSLLNPASTTKIDPVSQLMTDIISKFPTISTLPEQIATLYGMFLFVRWQIYPTAENYERLPEWITPRLSQLFTPHPAWIDHIPWPRMRDKLIANYHNYPFENWFLPFVSGLSVNWPYEPTDCLLSTTDASNGQSGSVNSHAEPSAGEGDNVVMTINPVFERHIRRLDNWSLGPMFAEAYPELVETTKISPQPLTQGQRRNAS